MQSPYLTDAFARAQGLYNNASNNVYSGDITAGFNPDQLATFRSMVGYGGNDAVPRETAAVGGALTGAGLNAVTGSLNQLAAFRPQGTADSTIADASRYADNPSISGMVDASMRDAVRSASESALPQIARQAALLGNTNSNRTALAQGVVQRGLADQAGDISANLRGQAYTQGLSLAQDANQFNTNAQLDAAKSYGSLGSGAVSSGLGGLGSSIGLQGDLFQLANAGGAGMRSATQAELDNARQRAEYGANTPFDLLSRYYGIVGDKNWGGTTTGSKTGSTTQSVHASPLSLAGMGLGLSGSFLGSAPAAGSLGSGLLSRFLSPSAGG